MDHKSRKGRGIGLCSGGLDSILSALVLRKQGVYVEWVSFETPFFSAEKARKAARMLDIPITVKQISRVYLKMLENPPCGYGKYMNPCMDCHALMFNQAGAIMKDRGFDFLFSGEVLGQRPMSQTFTSLRYVAKHSGWDGYILRPLSARKLPLTIAEEAGLVDRDQLLDLSGRSRKPQIALAKTFGVDEYPAPAGGCLLTDKNYSIRLRDLMDHQEEYSDNELNLLKYGRHFRLSPDQKIIVGRTEKDNQAILQFYDPQVDRVINVCEYPGPIVLVPKTAEPGTLLLAAAICAGYSKAPVDKPVAVCIDGEETDQTLEVLPLPPKVAREFLL